MKRFVISGEQKNVEISPTLVETLDESLDNMTISLEINDNPKPYKPIENYVRVYDDNTLITEFIISSDTVELVGTNPNRYKHTLSLVQNSQRFTKNLIRNTVFSTSLESSQFISTVSASVFIKSGPSSLGGTDLVPESYVYMSNSNVSAEINLDEKKINKIKCKVDFEILVPTKINSVGGSEIQLRTECICEKGFIKPRKWKDIFLDGYLPDTYGSTLPRLMFSINNNGTIISQIWTISNEDVNNGETINVPDSIVEWIQQNNNGTLNIYILNYGTGNATFMPQSAFGGGLTILDSKAPVLTNICYEFYFDSVEMSVYDVIDTLLKQYQKNTKAYNINNDGFIQPLFLLPTEEHNPELYNLLKNTSSPNFIFTQSSMFDALAEIFRLFDATFRIDEDGYLDIEYFNEHSPTEMPNSKLAGRSSSLGEERFANRLVTFFQNTKVNDKFPNSNNENATAYLRSKTLGVPSASDFVFMVPKPIDIINKIQMYAKISFTDYNTLSQSGYTVRYVFRFNNSTLLLDITNNVVESDLWSVLDNTNNLPINGNYNNVGKYNSLTYKRGDNYIDVSGYYQGINLTKNQIIVNVIQSAVYRRMGIGNALQYALYSIPSVDWSDIKLQVDYIALTDGKLVNESIDYKYDGEILTNQDNGSIDINKLGLNMVGLSLKLGQPTLTMTQKFTNWNDRIKKGQYFIDSTDGSKWVANTCSYTLVTNDIVQATIEFVKNFNGLASRIQLNREKRLSNISNELTVKCEENYGEYIFYSPNSLEDIYDETFITDIDGEPIALDQYEIANMFAMGFGGTLEKTKLGTINARATNKAVYLTWSDVATRDGNLRYLYIVSQAYVSGTPSNTGEIRISPDPNSLNQYFTVPKSSGRQDAIEYNPKTGEFFFNETDTFDTDPQTAQIVEGTEVFVTLIMEGNNILFAAINDVTHLPTSDIFDERNINSCYVPNTDRIEYALITALDADNNIIKVDDTQEVKNIAIPMVVYGSGNSVCFEMSFDSPISAGTQLLNDYTSNIWSGGWFSRHVLYTSTTGKAEKFTIDFVKMLEETSRCFPSMKRTYTGGYLDTYSYGKLEEFEYHKKPNEIFALNYQLHFLPAVTQYTYQEETLRDEGGFLTNEFIKNNGFANGLNTKKLYFQGLDSDSDPFSILDVKAENVSVYRREIVNAFAQKVGDYQFAMCFNLSSGFPPAIALRITHWAIVDEDDNIYFASNLGFRRGTSRGESAFSFEFMTRHHRLF